MTSWDPDYAGENSSDEEYDGPEAFKGRDALIFLVDAFLLQDNETKFKETLETIQNALLSGIVTRENDLIGIVFFNTKESPDPKDVTGIRNIVVSKNSAIFLPLKTLSKDVVEYFLNFIEPDYFGFNNRYGFECGSLANTLRMCTDMLKQCGFKLSTSSLIMFTGRDLPHPVNSNEFQKAVQKAKDLEGIDISFQLVAMSDNFDYEKFYKRFICIIRDQDEEVFVEPDVEYEKKLIANRNLKQHFRRNCQAHLKWSLGDELKISVAMYNYFKKSYCARSVKIMRTDNTVIQVKRVTKVGIPDPDTMEIKEEKYLKPGDERRVLQVGGRKISFTSDEVAKMRSPLTPGIRLLGFKSRTAINIHMYSKPCSCLYPDDNIISGSTNLFRALWEKCSEKEKIAICVMVSRRKSPPRYVALIPTTKTSVDDDSADDYVQNDGFNVFYLPFENDYRNLNLLGYGGDYPENGVELFLKIGKKLKVKYSPDMFKDPQLEVIQANIISSAFDIETEVNVEGGMPDTEMQDKRIEPFIDSFAEIFGEELQITSNKRSRSRNDDDGGSNSKILKISEECPSDNQISQLVATDQLDNLNNKQLKAYLQTKNVRGISSATKRVLIQKIKELDG